MNIDTRQLLGTIDRSMISHENDPFFIKKRDDAIAFLKKSGIPKELPGSDTFLKELKERWG